MLPRRLLAKFSELNLGFPRLKHDSNMVTRRQILVQWCVRARARSQGQACAVSPRKFAQRFRLKLEPDSRCQRFAQTRKSSLPRLAVPPPHCAGPRTMATALAYD